MKQVNEPLYPIACNAMTQEKNLDGVYVHFQKDSKDYYVPLNTGVNVPKWVYDIWVDSEWKPKNNTNGINPDHIRV